VSTALALVNRVRAKRRDATSSILTDRVGIAYLEMLNGAMTTVLEQRTWDFQRRHNGELYTVPSFSGSTSILPNPGNLDVFFSDYTGSNATVAGPFVTRLIVLGDPIYGQTAFRLKEAFLVVTTVAGAFENPWAGGNVGLTGWRTVTYEYLLPSTVRQVIEVRSQEQDQPLEFGNDPAEFYRAFPRPQDELSDQPEVVVVGGEIEQTVLSGGLTAFGLAMLIWPVPSAEYVLNYSYVYRHPRLVLATDNLERVPPAVEDLIVDLTVARVIIELEKDVEHGIPIENKILRDLDRLHRNHEPAAGKRPQMLSHDHVGRPFNPLHWLPRSVAGLPGS